MCGSCCGTALQIDVWAIYAVPRSVLPVNLFIARVRIRKAAYGRRLGPYAYFTSTSGRNVWCDLSTSKHVYTYTIIYYNH
jgi:hypothetical protein